MGLLRTIVILMIIYYIFKFFSRYIAPIFLRKMMKDVERRFNEQQNAYKNEPQNVGETIIDKKPSDSTQSRKDLGEYIDYEEVDE
ncbi:DUF4834 family protein [Lutibacter sp.]